MTCEDCIGYEFCDSAQKYTEQEIKMLTKDNDVRSCCSFFKNKANFVEVVRCGECAFRMPIDEKRYLYKGKPALHCFIHSELCGENEYCSHGVRKDGADNG